ncbi:MAG: ABC transporter permease [Pedosphaera sp.]|nr:ABC transporter permease [Pedosphaera sp.]
MLKWSSRELTVAGVLVILWLGLAVFAPDFFSPQPLLSRLTSSAPKLLVGCGIALVILTRNIDISVGSLYAVASVAAGHASHSAPTPAVIVAVAIVTGLCGGVINGFLVATLRLPSIVVTLATMVTWRESLRLGQQGVFINLPDNSQWFSLSMVPGQWTVVLTALVILASLAWAQKNLAAGRHLHAVGSDPEAARLTGISPGRTTFSAFVLCGVLTGLAAALNLVQSPQIDPNTGRLLELEGVAAAVVAGFAVSGGRGRLFALLPATLLLVSISPALTYLGAKPYWDKAVHGAIILAAVMADGLGRPKQGSRSQAA